MKRPQFTLRALLVAMLVVAAFLGGAEWGRRRYQPTIEYNARATVLTMPDGTLCVPYLADR